MSAIRAGKGGRAVRALTRAFGGCLLALCLPVAAFCAGLTLYTAEVPLYTYVVDGGFTGLATELARTLFERAGMPIKDRDIRFSNWARAYHTVMYTPDTALICLARTPERERLFKWVGPLAVTHMGLIAKKHRALNLSGKSDLSPYQIAVVRDSAGAEILQRLYSVPEKQLVRVSGPAAQVRMLKEGRVDMMTQADSTAFLLMQQLGIEPAGYEMVLELSRDELYLALNPGVDDAVVQRLQACLDELKREDGDGGSRYREILDHYSMDGQLDLGAP